MTAEEFEQQYAARSGITVEQLRALGRIVRPCRCDYAECDGWQSVNREGTEENEGSLTRETHMIRQVFLVWDHDPMDGSMGRDYLAKICANRTDAEAEVSRRNEVWKNYWIENASDGKNRLNETWAWKHARMVVLELE